MTTVELTAAVHEVDPATTDAVLDPQGFAWLHHDTAIVAAGVALEVCPVSNVALGVYSDLTSVPLPELLAAGATVALGADDPLLFGSRLTGQYATMRAAHELTDHQLAELARMSLRASCAPDDVVRRVLGEIDAWLAAGG